MSRASVAKGRDAGQDPDAKPAQETKVPMHAINRLDPEARRLIDLVKSTDLPPPGAKVVTWERLASKLVFAPDPDRSHESG